MKYAELERSETMSIMYEDLILQELQEIRKELHTIAEYMKSPHICVDGNRLKNECKSATKRNGFNFD